MAGTEVKLLRLKSGFAESLQPVIDELLPIVAQFGEMPPYSGEALDLFVGTAAKNAATGWLFLELVSNFWAGTQLLSGGEINSFLGSWGGTDSPVLLTKIIATALFNLDTDVETGEVQKERGKEFLTSVQNIVRRVVQQPAADSISGSIELNDVLFRAHLDPRSW